MKRKNMTWAALFTVVIMLGSGLWAAGDPAAGQVQETPLFPPPIAVAELGIFVDNSVIDSGDKVSMSFALQNTGAVGFGLGSLDMTVEIFKADQAATWAAMETVTSLLERGVDNQTIDGINVTRLMEASYHIDRTSTLVVPQGAGCYIGFKDMAVFDPLWAGDWENIVDDPTGLYIVLAELGNEYVTDDERETVYRFETPPRGVGVFSYVSPNDAWSFNPPDRLEGDSLSGCLSLAYEETEIDGNATVSSSSPESSTSSEPTTTEEEPTSGNNSTLLPPLDSLAVPASTTISHEDGSAWETRGYNYDVDARWQRFDDDNTVGDLPRDIPVYYWVNHDGQPAAIQDWQVRDRLREGHELWEVDKASYFDAEFVASVSGANAPRPTDMNDEQPVIGWADNIDEQGRVGGKLAIATVSTWKSADAPNRFIRDASIILNPQTDDDWFMGRGDVPADQNSFYSVAAHEFGHWLRLDHSLESEEHAAGLGGPTDGDQLMRWNMPLGTEKRLDWGDKAGLRYLYPNQYEGATSANEHTDGFGMDAIDIDQNGQADLVTAWVEDPTGQNTVRYQVGWNVDPGTGEATSWSTPRTAYGSGVVGSDTQGLGVSAHTGITEADLPAQTGEAGRWLFEAPHLDRPIYGQVREATTASAPHLQMFGGSLQHRQSPDARFGLGADLSGDHQYFQQDGSASPLFAYQDLTIFMAFEIDSLHTSGHAAELVSTGAPGETLGTNSLYGLNILTDGRIRYAHEYGAGNDVTATTAKAIGPGFHTISLQRDHSEGRVRIIVDDEVFFDAINVYNPTTQAPNGGTSGGFYVGRQGPDSDCECLDGGVYDVRVWNTLLASSTVDALHGMELATWLMEPVDHNRPSSGLTADSSSSRIPLSMFSFLSAPDALNARTSPHARYGEGYDLDGRLDGTPEYFASDDASLLRAGSVSVFMAFSLDRLQVANGNGAELVTTGAPGESLDTNSLYGLNLDSQGKLIYAHEYGSAGTNWAHPTGVTVSEGFHTLLLRRDAVSRTVNIWLDGTQIMNHQYESTQAPTGGDAGTFSVGRQGADSAPEYMDGAVYDVRVWDHYISNANAKSLLVGLDPPKPDLVFTWADNPSGGNNIRYGVLRDLDTGGFPRSSSDVAVFAPGAWVGSETQGLGTCLMQMDGNYRPDMVIAWMDNPSGENRLNYRIARNMDDTDYIQSTLRDASSSGPSFLGLETSGVGVACTQLDGGATDMVFSWVDNPSGNNKILYKIGLNPSASGTPSEWHHEFAPGRDVEWVGSSTEGGGLAALPLDGIPIDELVFGWPNNSAGGNEMLYRLEWNTRYDSHIV